MNQETLLDFINNVIIKNGIESNLDAERIRKSIADYREYLSKSGLADKGVLKAIDVIEENLDEYLQLAKSFKEAGLTMPTIPTNTNGDQKEQISGTIDSCAKTENPCGRGRTKIIQSGSCGTSRSSC